MVSVLLLLAVCTASMVTNTVAFSPASFPTVRADTPTRLDYRNYDDIIMDTSSTTEAASSSPLSIARQSSSINKHGSKSAMPPKPCDKATGLDVDADRMPLSILLEPPAPPLTEHLQTDMTPSRPSSRVTTTRYFIARDAVEAKFRNDDELKKILLETEDKIIVEAATDRAWGIGVVEFSSSSDEGETKKGAKSKDNCWDVHPDKWNGLNLLGRCLMDVREGLMGE